MQRPEGAQRRCARSRNPQPSAAGRPGRLEPAVECRAAIEECTRAMSSYYVANHVFFCRHGGHVVFLDLRQDRYLALDAAKADRILAGVRGWRGGESTAATAAATERAARTLVGKGLLTTDCSRGKEASGVPVDPATYDLLENDPGRSAPVRVRDVVHFLTAVVVAWLALKCCSLERVVSRIRRRRRSHALHPTIDLDAARRCVAAYERLRPFVFTAREACLFESLALIEFLARNGLYPAWVFGVQTAPFGAHCWVQHEGTVFNDCAEHARAFTPIMAV